MMPSNSVMALTGWGLWSCDGGNEMKNCIEIVWAMIMCDDVRYMLNCDHAVASFFLTAGYPDDGF